MLLDNQEFLTRVERIYAEAKDKKSVWLWFKQCPDRVGNHRKGKDLEERKTLQNQKNSDSQPFSLLVRLKTSKHRLSTKVASEEAAYFQRLLHNILLVNLPKR